MFEMLYPRGSILARFNNFNFAHLRNYRKNSSRIIKKMQLDENMDRLVSNSVIQSSKDVAVLKNNILKTSQFFLPEDIDRSLLIYFTKNKQFDNALSYIKFLEEGSKKKLHLFLTNQQFLIYFHKRYTNGSISTSEQDLIIESYNNLKESSSILDSQSLEHAILALSVTSKWPLCLILFDELKKLDIPSSICYSAMIAGAFLNDNEELAWSLINEMSGKQKTLNDVIFKAYFEKIGKISDKHEIFTQLEKLIRVCNENNVILSENTILDFSKLLNESMITNKQSSVNNKAYCENCQKKLKIFDLDEHEFENLKKKFLNGVIVGKNIFTKTSPAELSKFQKFLETLRDCNVFIDGLNVAYIAGTKQSPEVYASLIAKVVGHFVEKNKNVVVLGRKHMGNWPKKQWTYIQNNARIFLTQNISLDDPYLLYCALHGGKDAVLVSRDLMRSHLFALKDPKDKLMFSRWLEQRQLQITHVGNGGKIFFKYPRPYTRIAQHSDNYWHIPYNSAVNENDEANTISDKWLCIKKS